MILKAITKLEELEQLIEELSIDTTKLEEESATNAQKAALVGVQAAIATTEATKAALGAKLIRAQVQEAVLANPSNFGIPEKFDSKGELKKPTVDEIAGAVERESQVQVAEKKAQDISLLAAALRAVAAQWAGRRYDIGHIVSLMELKGQYGGLDPQDFAETQQKKRELSRKALAEAQGMD